MCGSILGMIFPLFIVLREFLGRSEVSCFATSLVPVLGITIAATCTLARVLVFYFRVERSHSLADYIYATSIAQISEINSEIVSQFQDHEEEQGAMFRTARKLSRSSSFVSMPRMLANNSSRSLSRVNSKSLTRKRQNSIAKAFLAGPKTIQKTPRFFTSQKFGLLLAFLVSSLVTLIIIIKDMDLIRNECFGCSIRLVDNNVAIVLCVLYVFAAFALYYCLRNEADALAILCEIKWATFFVLISGIISAIFHWRDPLNLEATGRISWDYFLVLGWIIAFAIVVPMQYRIAMRIKGKNNKDRNVPLASVLKHPVGDKLFRGHLIEEFSYENYLFYGAVIQWKELFRYTNDPQTDVCKKIINLYIKDGSPLQINISAAMRNEIMSTDPCETTFDAALQEVWKLMSSDSLIRFQASDKYKHFVSSTQLGSSLEEVSLNFDTSL